MKRSQFGVLSIVMASAPQSPVEQDCVSMSQMSPLLGVQSKFVSPQKQLALFDVTALVCAQSDADRQRQEKVEEQDAVEEESVL